MGAKRVVLDTIEVLFGAFGDDAIVRSELNRLMRWLEDRDVTVIMTGERGDGGALTRHGIEEYVTDCVITLDHRVSAEISTRLPSCDQVPRVGARHQRVPLPDLRTRLHRAADHLGRAGTTGPPRNESRRASPRLDHMLGGGMFRGSTLLVSGTAGTGKTSLTACMVNAACERGEQALMVMLEESPEQCCAICARSGST